MSKPNISVRLPQYLVDKIDKFAKCRTDVIIMALEQLLKHDDCPTCGQKLPTQDERQKMNQALDVRSPE